MNRGDVVNIRLTHIDGKLPNLALMKLAHWHQSQGDQVTLARTPSPSMFEPQYDRVYGSAIFGWSKPVAQRLQDAFPDAIIGGTGVGDMSLTVESLLELETYEHYDYSIYPEYEFSLGFTQRGCRLNCGFCVVPKKEGKPRSTNTIWDIWRPETERRVVLLDNDFFGQPESEWQARFQEIKEGGFKVSFNQGINIRMVTPEAAAAIASVPYYDDQFKTRRLYTAWDNLGQEKVFFNGVDMLRDAGIPPSHLMVYMLIGYKPGETMEEILYRYQRLTEVGCKAYPMVFNNLNPELKRFQRWVIRRYHEFIAWEDFNKAVPVKSGVPLPLVGF
ncbi:hypothetical protein LCGC14_0378560 [marine sediment metagenome]|uniref:Elp3/MiaA/NifB-like radical SAM core domain-containing protein n=1 Tax=marine sediment metagenome TaxID=412755 RepID=A0A0F9WBQ1_9ZZZZ